MSDATDATNATDAPQLEELAIRYIRRDGGTQARIGLDLPTVQRYADEMKGGATFPPVVVVKDPEGALWLADGFHRLAAAQAAGADLIRAEVRQGTRRDAVKLAAGANAKHGLNRTRADIQRAVEMLLNDPEWVQLHNRQIARMAGVSHPTVAKVRKRLFGETVYSGTVNSPIDDADADADADAVDTTKWDPWEGRTGNDARAWVYGLSDLALVEVCRDKAPTPTLKGSARKHAETLVELAAMTWSQLKTWGYSAKCRDAKDGALLFAVGLLPTRTPMERLQLSELDAFDAALRGVNTLEELWQVAASELPDARARVKVLRMLNRLGDVSQYVYSEKGWRRAQKESEQCGLPGLAQTYESRANEEASREAARVAAAQKKKKKGAETKKGPNLWWLIKAGEADDGVVQELLGESSNRSQVRSNTLSRAFPATERAKGAAALRVWREAKGEPIYHCPDPRCEGWAWEESWGCCWRCFRRPSSVAEWLEEFEAALPTLVEAGWGPTAALTLAPAEAPAPALVPATSPACPVCSGAVSIQLTVDRGEVLSEHDAAGDRCPGSSLSRAAAGALVEELDAARPQVVRLLGQLERGLKDPDWPIDELVVSAPRFVRAVDAWTAAAPGSPLKFWAKPKTEGKDAA